MGILISAPNYQEIGGPVIFLAGPIQGAERWQDEAFELIQRFNTDINVFSPRRPPGEGKKEQGDFGQGKYIEQVKWESYHLRWASIDGSILFWLAKEKNHDCGRSYAQTSRYELAKWVTLHKYLGNPIVIGIEPGFSGERYIRYIMSVDHPDIPILDTLDETCRIASENAIKHYNPITIIKDIKPELECFGGD